MRLLAIYIAVQAPETQNIFIASEVQDLSSIGIFVRGTAKDTFRFVCRESLAGLDKSTRHKITHENYLIYIQMSSTDRIGAYAFVEGEYPNRVMYDLLKKCLNSFQFSVDDKWKSIKQDNVFVVPDIQSFFIQYQDPQNVDKVALTLSNVQETQVVLHDNIQKLLESQGDIDALVSKSKDFNKAAQTMYKQTKDMKKPCCAIF